MAYRFQFTKTKHALLLLVISALALPTYVALAQSPASTSSEMALDFVPFAATSSPTPPNTFSTDTPLPSVQFDTRTQARIKNLAANISTKHEQTFARLRNISERLAARVQILKTQGVDTTIAQTKLDVINTNLINGERILVDIDTKVTAAVSAKDGRAGWSQVTPIYIGSKGLILNILTQLRAVVTELDAATAATSTVPVRPS